MDRLDWRRETSVRLYRLLRRLLLGTGISTFWPFNRVKAAWVRYLRSKPAVSVCGHAMRRDSGDYLNLAINGVYEEEETRFVERLVQPGWTVLDVGANVGYFTLILARAVGPSGRVHAFEPASDTFAILQHNVDANGYRNVTLVNKAVSNRGGELTLYRRPGNPGDYRIFPDPDEHPPTEQVGVVRLDDYNPLRDARVRFVKIDTQGAELWVLQGMEKLLRANQDIILSLEFWPYGLLKAGVPLTDLLNFLEGQGFEMFQFASGGKFRQVVDFPAYAAAIPVSRRDYVNILAARSATAAWLRGEGLLALGEDGS